MAWTTYPTVDDGSKLFPARIFSDGEMSAWVGKDMEDLAIYSTDSALRNDAKYGIWPLTAAVLWLKDKVGTTGPWLPLAGGTMSGAIDMGSNSLVDVGLVMGATGETLGIGGNGEIKISINTPVDMNGNTIVNAASIAATTFTGALTGNASTATALETARTINGTSFDGTEDITITAAAGTLTGATLASGVTASSLTSFGTSPTFVTPLLGTPTSGNLANCTFPASVVQTSQTGTVTNTMLAGSISLTTKVTGTLPVANGGTGLATLTAHALQVGNGTSNTTQLTLGTGGKVLVGQTGGDPSWTATPTLGVAGSTVGTLSFANATSGAVMVKAVTGALGATTVLVPAINGTMITDGDTGTVTNTMLAGSIAYSKLSLSGAILNSDLAGSIAYSKLSLTGAILNGDLAGSIADSKLSTISTAGKVSNSATTATDANTASAIVARDGSGNFTAGVVTADLVGRIKVGTQYVSVTDDATALYLTNPGTRYMVLGDSTHRAFIGPWWSTNTSSGGLFAGSNSYPFGFPSASITGFTSGNGIEVNNGTGGSTRDFRARTINATANVNLAATTTPSNPGSSSDANVYIKGGKYIIQYNNAGTVTYFYLDLTQTVPAAVWASTTTPP